MAVEVFGVDGYIINLFKNDAQMQTAFGGTPKVYVGEAPEKTDGPYIVFDVVPTNDKIGMGTARIFSDTVWWFDVWGTDGYYALKSILDRVDGLLQGVGGVSYEGVYINKFRRQSIIRDIEKIDGVKWFMVRQLYRNIIHPG